MSYFKFEESYCTLYETLEWNRRGDRTKEVEEVAGGDVLETCKRGRRLVGQVRWKIYGGKLNK